MPVPSEPDPGAPPAPPAPDEAGPAGEPGSSWVLVRGSRRTWRAFRAAAVRLPRRAWRVWLAWLVGGFAATLAVMAGLSFLARRLVDDVPDGLEAGWLERFVELSPLPFSAAIYLGVPADSIFLAVVVIVATVVAARRGHPMHASTSVLSLALPDLVVVAGWLVWNRARPDFVHDGIAAPGLHSFPSGHVVQAVVVYGVLAHLWASASGSRAERGLAWTLWLVVVALVAATRLELGVHWPSDVLAGLLVGGVLLAAMLVALRRGLAAARDAEEAGPARPS